MEAASIKSSKRNNGLCKNFCFDFIPRLKLIEHIEVYDNDKYLILVGMDKEKNLNHIIKFNRYSLDLDYQILNELYSVKQTSDYLEKTLNTNNVMKFYKYRIYAVFGIYKFYKLTYISFVKGAKEVAKLLGEPIYEIKECEMFAIQSKKFYK